MVLREYNDIACGSIFSGSVNKRAIGTIENICGTSRRIASVLRNVVVVVIAAEVCRSFADSKKIRGGCTNNYVQHRSITGSPYVILPGCKGVKVQKFIMNSSYVSLRLLKYLK